ncbi:TetR/AcrR family transcriptional regulator [Nocardia sp. NPDC046473]|uniref:TetR/AcrR family transcriptional regulator n=1 Tax=Nocardia sp. NPDC046473 TaxID=3155733 RepID=UPI0033E39365
MPRPAIYDTDLLLDTATRIVATTGVSGLSVKAVVRASGAPSGSVYHRFPTGAALSGALWIRTLERFHAGLLPLLAADDPVEACVDAARYVLTWSRDHPDEAHVLLAGPAAYTPDRWTSDQTTRNAELDAALRDAVTTVARRLEPAEHTTDKAIIAVIDLPYAIVRRYLGTNSEIPCHMEELVANSARAIVTPP